MRYINYDYQYMHDKQQGSSVHEVGLQDRRRKDQDTVEITEERIQKCQMVLTGGGDDDGRNARRSRRVRS